MKTLKAILHSFRLLYDVAVLSPMRLLLELASVAATVLNSMLVRIYIVKLILDNIVAGNFDYAIGLIVIAAACDFLLSSYETWMNSWFRPRDNIKLHEKFQKRLYRRAVGVGIQYYDNPEYFDSFIMAAKNSDVNAVKAIDAVKEFLITVAEIIISGGFIVSGLIEILIIVLVLSTTYMILSVINAKVRVGVNEAVNPKQKKMEYVKRIFFSKTSAVDIRTAGIRKPLLNMLDNACNEAISDGKKHVNKRFVYMLLMDIVFYIQFVSIIFVLAWRALGVQDISVGDFSMLLSSAFALGNNWRFFGQTVSGLAEFGMLSDHYYGFLALPNEKKSAPVGEYEKISFNDVGFTYPSGEKPVFDGVSFDLKKHERIAIVGPNGAGKTTLVNLMLGFYAPNKGEVSINGNKLTSVDRNRFSLIFQDSRLYPFSVAENLLLRKPDGDEDECAVKEALKKVGLLERIEALPNSLNTHLTKEFDNSGVVFSGGEAQRLMLARAILHKREVYIMDEPTAAQDPKAESELNQLFTELMEDETVMLITHRLSTLSGVNYIFLLDDGKIIESGTHDELMQLGGRYAGIYKAQSELYSIEG